MFIDLDAGILGSGTLGQTSFSGQTVNDSGMIKVQYFISGLSSGQLAAFDAYAYTVSSNQGQGIRWTNRLSDSGSSGYAVNGVTTTPVASFTADTTTGSAPLTVQFTDTSSNNPTTWSWDFNNNGVIDSNVQNPTWTYNNQGNYTVTLTAGNSIANNTLTKTDYITVNWPATVANFTTNTTSGAYPLTVQFTDTSTGNITSWNWDFNNDGVIDSTEQNPSYTFNTPGNYTIILTVSGPYNNNTITQNDYITVFNSTPPTVTATPDEGIFNGTQNVTLTSDQAGSVYYTIDGSNPTDSTNSNRIPYTVPIQVYNTTVLQFAAVNSNGVWSQKYSKNYTIDTSTPNVTANPEGGLYNTTQSVVLNGTDTTTNTTVYYTTDGTDPQTSSTRNVYTAPVTVNSATTLRYIAVDMASNWSPEYSQTYIIDTVAPTASTNLTGGAYNTTQIISLTSDDLTATIYYANDTTNPQTSSTRIQYTGPITLSKTTTLRFAAVDPAGNWSPLYVQNYVIGNGTGIGGLADTPWAKSSGNINNTGLSNYTGPGTNNGLWTYTTGNYIYYVTPTIGSDGTIYVGSYDGKLYALNPDGTLKWNYTTGGYIYGSTTIGSDGTIYVGSYDGKLYALNVDGTLRWNYTTGGRICGSATIGSDGTIYVGSFDKKLYALNPDGTLKWSYTTGGYIYSYGGSPAIGSDGTIYMGSYDKKLYALNPDGTLKWNYTTGGYIYGPPSIGSDGTIFIGSYDGKLYALNPDGTLKWNYTTGGRIYASPSIGSDGTIYMGSFDKKLYALNPDGTLKWSYTTGGYIYGSATIGSDGTIYMGSYDKKLYALNPDGTLKWSYTTGGYIYGSPAIGADGSIYFGSYDKKIYFIKDPANITVNTSLTSGTYNNTQTVTLTCDDPTSTIYYTNNTTDPRLSITRIQYTGPITLNTTTTLRYAALDASGNWSILYIQNYLIGNGTGNEGLANSAWPKYLENNGDTGLSSYIGPQTNNIIWTYTTGGTIYFASPTIGSDGTIYIGSSDGNLYALNSDGTLKWNYTTGNGIWDAPTIGSDGTIYFGNANDIMYALNSDGTLKWNYTSGGLIWGSPAIGADGTIYFGTYSDYKLYALNSDGTLKWTYTTGSYIRGSPTIGADGTIYFGSADNFVYALNPDGTLKWSYNTGSWVWSSPVIGLMEYCI